VQAETKHVWLDLCAEAAICEDPTRLEQLAILIGDILREEQQRLNGKMSASSNISESRKQGAA